LGEGNFHAWQKAGRAKRSLKIEKSLKKKMGKARHKREWIGGRDKMFNLMEANLGE